MRDVDKHAAADVAFQSTPPVAGERCLAGLPRVRLHHRFNPRPPLPGSDAERRLLMRLLPEGFNPRPPLPGSDAHLP